MPVTIVGNNTPTAGGVVYGDGTNYASTAAGTSGQVLQSNGSSAPTWATPSTGPMVHLTSIDANAASTVDFTTLTSAYPLYMIVGENIDFSATTLNFSMRLYAAGAWRTSLYNYNCISNTNGTLISPNQTGQTIINLYGDTVSRSSGQTGGIVVYVPYTTSTSIYRTLWWTGTVPKTNSGTFVGSGYWSDSILDPVTGVRFYASTGTISGNFSLYGLKNS